MRAGTMPPRSVRAISRRLRAVCERNGVEILDLSKLVPDEEFADSVHLTTFGIDRFQGSSREIPRSPTLRGDIAFGSVVGPAGRRSIVA